MKKVLLILCALIGLTSCASFEPKKGMTFQEFRKMSVQSVNGEPQLIRQSGNYEIYQLRSSNRNLAPSNSIAKALYDPNKDFSYVFASGILVDTLNATQLQSYSLPKPPSSTEQQSSVVATPKQQPAGTLEPVLMSKYQSLSPAQKGEIAKKYNDSPIYKQMGFVDGNDAFTFCGAVQDYKLEKYSKQSPPDKNGNIMQQQMYLTKLNRDTCRQQIATLIEQRYWTMDAFGALNKKYLSEVMSASDNVKADGGKKLADMVLRADKVNKVLLDTYPQFVADELKKK